MNLSAPDRCHALDKYRFSLVNLSIFPRALRPARITCDRAWARLTRSQGGSYEAVQRSDAPRSFLELQRDVLIFPSPTRKRIKRRERRAARLSCSEMRRRLKRRITAVRWFGSGMRRRTKRKTWAESKPPAKGRQAGITLTFPVSSTGPPSRNSASSQTVALSHERILQAHHESIESSRPAFRALPIWHVDRLLRTGPLLQI